MNRLLKGMTMAFALLGLLLFSVKLFGHDPKVPKEILTKNNPVTSSDSVMSKARSQYEENCLMCHGEKGHGDGPMASMLKSKPADISDVEMLGEMTDGEIYWIITKGVKPMPQFETKFSDEERWGLVHLMRSMSNTESTNTPKDHHH